MALESSVAHIADLNPLWPTPTESKSQGDDHFRNIKAAIANDFAGFAGAVMVTGADGGGVNAYTVTPARPLVAYAARMAAIFSPNATNTGPVTLNISALGAKSIKTIAGADLVAGDLVAGLTYVAMYNGAEFRLSSITKNYVDQLVIAGIVPGSTDPANAGKYFTTDGTTGTWATFNFDSLGVKHVDKGSSGTNAQVLNYAAGESQKLNITGNCAISTANWPAAGRMGALMLKMVNGGAFTITWGGITWIKQGGDLTTNFSLSGITFKSAGTDFILFWSDDGGATVYAKVIR